MFEWKMEILSNSAASFTCVNPIILLLSSLNQNTGVKLKQANDVDDFI